MKKIIIIIIASLLFFSCGQVKQMKRFGECDIKYVSIDSVMLAGIPMSKNTMMDNLSLFKVKSILNSFMKGSAQLDFKIFLKAHNHNSSKAAINQMDWQLYLDDKKVLEGINTGRIEIAGHDSALFHIDARMDLVQTLRMDNLNSILDLTYSLLDVKKAGKNPSKPVHFKLLVRPSFKIGKTTYFYPRYLTVLKDLSR